jgi:cell division protein FtsB
VPSFFCEGRDFTVVKIPGLNSVMNGPLEFIRRGIIWVVLLLFIAISGYLTFIINNLKKVVKLLTFDKREWQGLLSVLRIFVTIFFILNALFFIYVML